MNEKLNQRWIMVVGVKHFYNNIQGKNSVTLKKTRFVSNLNYFAQLRHLQENTEI